MGALSQWAEIEAGMQTHYNLSAEDIWLMSWRRFQVLFSSIFSWNGPDDDDDESPPSGYQANGEYRSKYQQAVHEARGASGEISRSFDWDNALGRDKPDSREILTVAELKARMGQDG